MTAIALGMAWAVVVAVVLGPRGAPARLPRPDGPALSMARPPAFLGRHPVAGAALLAPAAAIGGWLRRTSGRPPDRDADRRVGRATLAAAALALVAPPLAIVPLAWSVLAPALASQRSARAHEAAITDQLPDVVDLLVLTTAAGLPITAAVTAIGRRPGGPLGAALERAANHIERGGTTASALGLVLDRAGASARPLVEALAAHDRYGTPLAPALERVAIESRLRRRRQAEEAARRLPVTLLFPLVLTTLPAFALLTVVPLLAGSFGSLSP
jgi:tight adherence protein C